jgi:tRNA U34 2-thiouridine synthase MnmA/TrmU
VTGSLDAGRHDTIELALAEPVDGAAPGQLACLMDGDLVVGWGTIARSSGYRTLKSASRSSVSA